MNFKKIIVLENDNEQDADNHQENRIIRKNFSKLPVEYWYRFLWSFKEYDGRTGYARMAAMEEDTLLLTYTTFANGVMSGYGDLLGAWIDNFISFAKEGKRLNICVICVPAIHWQLIKWVLDGNTKGAQRTRSQKVRKCLSLHNVYSLYFDQHDFSEAGLITPEWFDQNYYPYDSKVINEGGRSCTTGLPYGGDYFGSEVYYGLHVQVPGKPPGYTTSGAITLDKLKELNPRKPHKPI